jgi:cytochrome c5
MQKKRSIDLFPSSPFRWEGVGACPGPDPRVRAQAVLYADTHESRAYGILLSILKVGALVVSLVVGSGKTALAASAGGNDPGASTFAANCATCHAQNGSGDTTVGKSVKIPDLRSSTVQSQSDAQLAEIIAHGKGVMPAFSSLSKDEIDALVIHVRELAKTK